MLPLDTVIILIALALLVWLWQVNLGYRELAIRLVSNVCAEMNLQLLDESVALTGFFLQKRNGRLVGVRRYSFDVSANGADRYGGYVILYGGHLIYSEFKLPDGPVILQKNDLNTYH